MFLVLDTNIFRAHPLRGVHFAALSRMSASSYIDFRIPYVVDNEVVTQRVESIRKSFSAIESNIAKLRANEDVQDSDRVEIGLINERVSEIHHQLVFNKVRENWEEWKSFAEAEILPLTEAEATAGMDAYFNGSDPFEKKKSRKDIPDSFIYQQLRTLARQGDVVFVCKDGRLRSAAESLDNVVVMNDLPDFLDSEVAQNYFTNITAPDLSNNLDAIKTFLRDRSARIQEIVRDQGGEKIVNEPIEFEGSYSNDDEHSVSSYGEVAAVSLDFNELNYYGDGEFELPVEFEMEASIEYFIDKAEYYSLLDSDAPSVSDWNDYVYLAESEETVLVKGVLKIETSVDVLSDIVTGGGDVDFSDFEITIDSVDSVEVVS